VPAGDAPLGRAVPDDVDVLSHAGAFIRRS
jgi:hypothetical protein